ncbi:HNH endonuclease [Paenibacillus lautus]|uniref:HNH endonuclease n=1 Tax=Paenibacillus lautus TaxID=1401 RepID=UPI003986A8DC
MRSLTKGNKPDILQEKEDQWTKDLLDYVNRGEKIPDSIGGRYRHANIKDALLVETYNKCVYCESKVTHISHGDIEHIVPKSVFREKTFTWENLTIGCTKCNQNKLAYYDPALPILNPYTDKPETHIRFWGPLPFPVDGDKSAEMTIRLLKLDRPELIERRTDHIKSIEPLLKQYEDTDNQTLKSLIWDDIMALTLVDKEFSLMVEHFVNFKFPVTA